MLLRKCEKYFTLSLVIPLKQVVISCVIPVKTGMTQEFLYAFWIPAFVGMKEMSSLCKYRFRGSSLPDRMETERGKKRKT